MDIAAESEVQATGSEDLASRAESLYDECIRPKVENAGNVGKMVIIDVETGDFGVDDLGFDAANVLRRKNPNARLFGIRIGYDVAAALGGIMNRTVS
jgi:hypothetical protein